MGSCAIHVPSNVDMSTLVGGWLPWPVVNLIVTGGGGVQSAESGTFNHMASARRLEEIKCGKMQNQKAYSFDNYTDFGHLWISGISRRCLAVWG